MIPVTFFSQYCLAIQDFLWFHIFYPYPLLSFISLNNHSQREVFSSIKSDLTIQQYFLSWFMLLVLYLRAYCQSQCCIDFFFFYNFTQCFMLKSLIFIWLIIVEGINSAFNLFYYFAYRQPIVSVPFVEETLFFH